MNAHEAKAAADSLRVLVDKPAFAKFEQNTRMAIKLLEWRAGERSDEELTAVVARLRVLISGQSALTHSDLTLEAAIGLIERLTKVVT